MASIVEPVTVSVPGTLRPEKETPAPACAPLAVTRLFVRDAACARISAPPPRPAEDVFAPIVEPVTATTPSVAAQRPPAEPVAELPVMVEPVIVTS